MRVPRVTEVAFNIFQITFTRFLVASESYRFDCEEIKCMRIRKSKITKISKALENPYRMSSLLLVVITNLILEILLFM